MCDAVVSGVAGVLPELTTLLFHQRNSAEYHGAAQLLAELIRHLSAFPVPWGLKFIAEFRGITPAWFSQPLSAASHRSGRRLTRLVPRLVGAM